MSPKDVDPIVHELACRAAEQALPNNILTQDTIERFYLNYLTAVKYISEANPDEVMSEGNRQRVFLQSQMEKTRERRH